MISRIPADVVRPGEPQKRPNSRWSDGESKTGFSLSSPGRELVFQPTLPRRVSQFSIPWILARASARLSSVQNGHCESHRYGSFCLARLNSHDGEEGEPHWKIADSIKSWTDFRGLVWFSPVSRHSPKKISPAQVLNARSVSQKATWSPTGNLKANSRRYYESLSRSSSSFFLPPLCLIRDSGLLYFSLHSRTVLILGQVRRTVNQAHRHPISPANSITSQLPSN